MGVTLKTLSYKLSYFHLKGYIYSKSRKSLFEMTF